MLLLEQTCVKLGPDPGLLGLAGQHPRGDASRWRNFFHVVGMCFGTFKWHLLNISEWLIICLVFFEPQYCLQYDFFHGRQEMTVSQPQQKPGLNWTSISAAFVGSRWNEYTPRFLSRAGPDLHTQQARAWTMLYGFCAFVTYQNRPRGVEMALFAWDMSQITRTHEICSFKRYWGISATFSPYLDLMCASTCIYKQHQHGQENNNKHIYIYTIYIYIYIWGGPFGVLKNSVFEICDVQMKRNFKNL